ncbi:hypothetical protein Celf_3095 [Cellulomonas fimi ATCC 484]|uniref:Uncharacterized protein n=1 Tax=Cellulomonas fimi (strain ATCC 484 / DSM 20113 / JCM 1341 / CCUG 24087 / LMG 16345 / NBRC 15513 / NCIMB 8980 / NCTC 7547 / NRS-133) TaxID=590998 RepID=F4GZ94_CELFA|nr:hypothetical protein Celf_3095 [Cellulomonas fimi ATCC 484]VEH35598.1 Uncharacterised protein [Cellulomonas fimi]
MGQRRSAVREPVGRPPAGPGAVVVRGHAPMLAPSGTSPRGRVRGPWRPSVPWGLWTARALSARQEDAAGAAAGFEAGEEVVVDEEEDSAGFDDDEEDEELFDEDVVDDDRASFR